MWKGQGTLGPCSTALPHNALRCSPCWDHAFREFTVVLQPVAAGAEGGPGQIQTLCLPPFQESHGISSSSGCQPRVLGTAATSRASLCWWELRRCVTQISHTRGECGIDPMSPSLRLSPTSVYGHGKGNWCLLIHEILVQSRLTP